MEADTIKAEMLTCNCKNSRQWEIGKNAFGRPFIRCVQCGDQHPVIFNVTGLNSKLSWEPQLITGA